MSILHFFRNQVNNDLLFEVILCVAVFIGFILVAKVFSYIIRYVLKPFTSRTETQFDDLILEIIENSSKKLLVLLGGYVSLMIFKDGFELLDVSSNKTLIQQHPYLNKTVTFLDNALFVILIGLLLIIGSRIISLAFDWYAEKTKASENKDLSGSLFPLLKKVSRLLLAILAGVVILAKFNIDISAFIVSLGVGSLAIALAAQETLSNMISGFIIMVDRPFRIGDRIKIGSDIYGDVTAIGIRSTKILDFDKNILLVPNNDIVKSRIINFTYPTSRTRVVVDIPVAYNNDIQSIKQMLLNIAQSDPHVDMSDPPDVSLIRFGDTYMEFKLAVKTDDYHNAFDLGCRLREKIYAQFTELGISFPIPARNIYMNNSK
ncbi:MAG: mechanosensitive ion channel family protein [Ignavibacteria bacterium]|nr:mechanosensitive ion channel family protein [Ignavibacteria bacterium]